MKCPKCGADLSEAGPDRFGFYRITCPVCGWSKWNTTIAQEMAKEEMGTMDTEGFQMVGAEA